MRVLVLSVSVLGIVCLGATCALAQTGPWGQAEDQIPPYRTHVDMRHGHNRVYPDRGAVVREVPRGATGVNYAGFSYSFAAGVWYERVGPAYIVVLPPIGLIVPNLPEFATGFDSAGKTYLYADDVFYRPRPDLGGYEVVNDPQDAELERLRAPAGVPPTRLASAAPTAVSVRLASAAPAAVSSRPASPVPTAIRAAAHSPVHAASIASPSGLPTIADSSGPPPPGSPAPANPTGVAISPRNGQSADQQAMDRYECYRFAVAQTGFDPLAANSGTATDDVIRRDAVYSRIQAACLEDRGYSVP